MRKRGRHSFFFLFLFLFSCFPLSESKSRPTWCFCVRERCFSSLCVPSLSQTLSAYVFACVTVDWCAPILEQVFYLHTLAGIAARSCVRFVGWSPRRKHDQHQAAVNVSEFCACADGTMHLDMKAVTTRMISVEGRGIISDTDEIFCAWLLF